MSIVWGRKKSMILSNWYAEDTFKIKYQSLEVMKKVWSCNVNTICKSPKMAPLSCISMDLIGAKWHVVGKSLLRSVLPGTQDSSDKCRKASDTASWIVHKLHWKLPQPTNCTSARPHGPLKCAQLHAGSAAYCWTLPWHGNMWNSKGLVPSRSWRALLASKLIW